MSATDEPKYRDEAWLRENYIAELKSTIEIAEECDCSDTTIQYWLKKYGIEMEPELRRVKDKRLTDADWLRRQYLAKNRTGYDIAEECGCSFSNVYTWLKRHGIEIAAEAHHAPDSRLLDKEWLREKYSEDGYTMQQIARECGCSENAVGNWLEKHDIEVRWPINGKEHPRWNGGRSAYGHGWSPKKRSAVRERDDFSCQDPRCSVTQTDHLDEYGQKLHVHHLRKARDIDDEEKRNAKENLITLCRDCHRRWEKIADAGLVPEVDR